METNSLICAVNIEGGTDKDTKRRIGKAAAIFQIARQI